MLKLLNVEVIYNSVILVLRGISASVDDGQVVTLLGGNGAGKTTVLKSISGMLKTELGEVTAGTIELGGLRIDRLRPQEIARMGVMQVMEGRRVLPHLTTEENLRMGGYICTSSDSRHDLETVYGYFPRLKSLHYQTSGYLSGGEQQMMVIGRALMGRPRFMLLDEPSLGLAPMLVKEIFQIVKRINEEEKTSILLVEQNARAGLSIASYGYVMENGRIVYDGEAEKLMNNEDIMEFYLGFSGKGERKSYRNVKHYKRRKRWL
ncbi:MAG: ABC transporter ATP-binding protein [Thermodesulfobacteriota bacterium]|nr:ABC transporter ATP-binding protein [Thermodesulfobacteriota bacterium]